MALIRCPECGKEISDKAVACINCGCPVSVATAKTPAPETPHQNVQSPAAGTSATLSVNYDAVLSGAENEKSMQSVFVKELGRKVEFSVDNDLKAGETYRITLKEGSPFSHILFTASTVSRVPKIAAAADTPTRTQSAQTAIDTIKKYKPNLMVRFFKSGFIGKVLSMTITFIVVGRFGDVDMEVLIPIIGGGIVLLLLGSAYPMVNVKRYFRKHHIDEAIRNDSGYMNVAISAFNMLPTKKMLKYIKGLNPSAAEEIERQLADKKKK